MGEREDSLEDLLAGGEELKMSLHQACRLGDLAAIAQAFKSHPAQVNSKDSNVPLTQLGWTPLYRSVVCGHMQATDFLLKHGADPNERNNVSSSQLEETPLHHATDNGLWELAEMLIKHGAEVNVQQSDGDTPLHHAVFRGDERMVELLLAFGADCNIQNYLFGQTPLHYASDCGYMACVQLLLEKQGDALLMDKQGKTAIELAQTEAVRQVLLSSVQRELASSPSLYGRETPVIETFGKVDSAQSSVRTAPFVRTGGTVGAEPDAEKSISRSKRSEAHLQVLRLWLEKHTLLPIYELLINSGYDDLDALIEQMRSPLPLSEENLKEAGVDKPGYRVRLMMKLEEEAGLHPKKSRRRGASPTSAGSLFSCCTVPGNATIGQSSDSPLREWLLQMKLEHLYGLFVDAGYDDYEALLAQMAWRIPVTDDILERDIGIDKPGHRSRILSKLQEETHGPPHSPTGEPVLSMESEGMLTACAICTVS